MVLAVLLGVLAATIVEFNKVDPFAAQLLLPYLGWTTFATALTYWIGLHNTRVGRCGACKLGCSVHCHTRGLVCRQDGRYGCTRPTTSEL